MQTSTIEPSSAPDLAADLAGSLAPASTAPPEAAPVKPRLRGVSHQVAFFVAVAATYWLVDGARTPAAARAGLIFGASLAFLLGTSALYHRIDWAPIARMRMRRLDHAAIFLLIAGGFTPLFSLIPSSSGGHGALAFIWAGAMVGVVKSIAWPKAPKWLTALVCVVLGWTVVGQVLDRTAIVGQTCVNLLVVGGASYSVGAIVYALKRPDPWPKTFGYHEIFHLVVILASASVFAHVVLVMRAV